MTKKTIKLTEGELQKIVKESVKNVLSEGSYDMNHNFDADSHNQELKESLKNEVLKINGAINNAIVTLDRIAQQATDKEINNRARNIINALLAAAKQMNETNYNITNDRW